ncbi:MAG TPA: substrate-binding domain-containing protein [Ktedonobacteraceae bacterium]|nr:substrate-binding domain-containing protein [Ktedonobacteraceae bacterium]
MEAVLEQGLRVPQDISIIGLDDIVISAHLRPPLTTIAVPKSQLAQEATELLLAQIAGEEELHIARLVEPYLVVRQSTTSPLQE